MVGPWLEGQLRVRALGCRLGSQAGPQQDCTVRGQMVAGAIVECQEWPLNQSEVTGEDHPPSQREYHLIEDALPSHSVHGHLSLATPPSPHLRTRHLRCALHTHKPVVVICLYHGILT